jgi:hypothetical protein
MRSHLLFLSFSGFQGKKPPATRVGIAVDLVLLLIVEPIAEYPSHEPRVIATAG